MDRPLPCPFATTPARAAAVLAACFAVLGATPSAQAAGEHEHPAPAPPAAGDPRFMAGTVGPVVFRGTAATVTIPDGPGFGAEQGRRQDAGDLRKNNYSVTDANFNNVLGLLPRHPDTRAELTYVQHIQLYAAAGFLETFAPAHYGHMVMHQNRGEGTVLGAAGSLMGLVRATDPAAHGLDASTIPTTLPGTSIDSRNYVRAARDATGQDWARPHHAQTAPAVYRMLVEAGLPWNVALVLASDDGISGAGRINGMNEQNGSDGFNSGERATWALAAQLQAQTGIPVVEHMMHGHDHAGLDASALTKPKANAIIGFPADDRAASPERAAALYQALSDGRIATPQTAAADTKLTLRNESFLRPRSVLDVDVDAPWDWNQEAGVERTMSVVVDNHGPHFLREVGVALVASPNLAIVRLDAPAGASCSVAARTCSLGDVSGESERKRTVRVTVRFSSVGTARLEARASSSSVTEPTKLSEEREYGIHAPTTASLGVAAGRAGLRASRCGALLRRACLVRRAAGASLIVAARPGRYGELDRRWVKVEFQQRVGRRWRGRGDQWIQVGASGAARMRVKPDRFRTRGSWRARVVAEEYWLLREATSRWRYLTVR